MWIVSLIMDVRGSGSKMVNFRVERACQDNSSRAPRYLVVEAVRQSAFSCSFLPLRNAFCVPGHALNVKQPFLPNERLKSSERGSH